MGTLLQQKPWRSFRDLNLRNVKRRQRKQEKNYKKSRLNEHIRHGRNHQIHAQIRRNDEKIPYSHGYSLKSSKALFRQLNIQANQARTRCHLRSRLQR